MTGWSWVEDLLERPPRFLRPQDWQWPRGARGVGQLRQVGAGGRYELVGTLGKGGQAIVWAAVDRGGDDRLVVVKAVNGSSPDAATAARLSREARLLDRLSGSPVVMPVLDWGPGRLRDTSHDEFETHEPWLVLPYVEHVLLQHALPRRGPSLSGGLGVDAAWHLGRDLALALDHLHTRGVVHRDLSPGNLLLTTRGAVLSDLGLAWAASLPDAPVEDRFTTGLSVAGPGGTPGWFSPEGVLRPRDGGRPDRDPAYDVFPWGLLVFAALTGRHPWSADALLLTDVEWRGMYIGGERPDFSAPVEALADSGRLLDLVRAALAPEPRDRPTAAEIVQELGARSPEAESAALAAEQRDAAQQGLLDELVQAREQLRIAQVAGGRPRSASAAARPGLSPRRLPALVALVLAPLLAVVVAGGAGAWQEASAAAAGAHRARAIAGALGAAAVTNLALDKELNQALFGARVAAGTGRSAAGSNDLERLRVLVEATDASRTTLLALRGAADLEGSLSAQSRSAFAEVEASTARLADARRLARAGRDASAAGDVYQRVQGAHQSLLGSLVADLSRATDDRRVVDVAREVAALAEVAQAASAEQVSGTELLLTAPVSRNDVVPPAKMSIYLRRGITEELAEEAVRSLPRAGAPAAEVTAALDTEAEELDKYRRDVRALLSGIDAVAGIREGRAGSYSETIGRRVIRFDNAVVAVVRTAVTTTEQTADAARRRAWAVLGGIGGAVLLSLLLAGVLVRRLRHGAVTPSRPTVPATGAADPPSDEVDPPTGDVPTQVDPPDPFDDLVTLPPAPVSAGKEPATTQDPEPDYPPFGALFQPPQR